MLFQSNSSRRVILPIFLMLLLLAAGVAEAVSVYDLTCEHKVDPMGIESQNPRLSWKIESNNTNCLQSAYAIRVLASPEDKGKLIWESGKVESSESHLVPYSGPALESGQRVYWQVKVWDEKGKSTKWSYKAFWEMGILNDSGWNAQWIEPVQDTIADGPAHYLRKEFNLKGKIKRARIYATAHGLYELELNGKIVGDEFFTPGWTTYQKRLQYQVFDVTNMLLEGANAIGAALGDGWWRGYLAWQDNWGSYGKKVDLLCQIVVEFENGSVKSIGTDDSWKSTNDGPIQMQGLYNGETYDARKELTGWSKVGYDDSGWTSTEIADYGYETLLGVETVPVRAKEEFKPVKIWTTPKGTLVADMGQNLVGWIRLKVEGPAGTQITIRHAEVMDKEGEFYTENLRAAKATVHYTLNGGGPEIYEPTFTFMGFRYVAIDGFPGELTAENLTGVAIYSDMEPTGNFECSNALINQLQHNIQWGQRGNFLDIPTDCPQRDERLGWTGDAQAFIRTAAYNMDVAGFFTKWLKDVAAEQDERGAIPFVVPNVLDGVIPSAGWADVVTIAPWTIYQVFGDRDLLARQYPSMKKFVEYIRKTSGRSHVWKGGSIFGDWLFFKPELRHWTVPDGHTDQDLIATAFFGYSTKLLIAAAEVLGKTEDVETYTEVFERVKKAFNDNYVTPAGRITSHSQTSYVLAIMFDLLSEDQKRKAVNHLVDNIRGRDNHLSTGFLGTPYLCHVLSDNGKLDVAYDLLLQESFPSWLYPVTMGATTIWERWDGMKPDSTFQNKGMNSFNHYAYGAIGDWMYRVVAGIEIGAPGYKKIKIQPRPDSRLDYAKADYESPYGRIESGWRAENGVLTVSAMIPPNTTAEIRLPVARLEKVKVNGKKLVKLFPDAKEVDGDIVLNAGSGQYTFVYNTSVAVKITKDAPDRLVKLMNKLAAKEKNPLMKRHFETVALMTQDSTHGYTVSEEDINWASKVLNFFENEGSEWKTYKDGPRPLMMSFVSPTDGKRSFYWLFLPKKFKKNKKDYPLYVELHGSGGGRNNNPRKMLYHPLQPEIAGVTSQGYRKEGLFIYPWGRGDKGYRDIAETYVFEVLSDFDAMFETDANRQYLYGFSMGGGGTFRIAQKSLDRWAAIGVYSGAMRNPTLEQAKMFRDIPVWMTWGEQERRLTEVNTKLKDLFLEAGVDVKWTEVEGVGHRYLGEYQEDLMDWLKGKSK